MVAQPRSPGNHAMANGVGFRKWRLRERIGDQFERILAVWNLWLLIDDLLPVGALDLEIPVVSADTIHRALKEHHFLVGTRVKNGKLDRGRSAIQDKDMQFGHLGSLDYVGE